MLVVSNRGKLHCEWKIIRRTKCHAKLNVIYLASQLYLVRKEETLRDDCHDRSGSSAVLFRNLHRSLALLQNDKRLYVLLLILYSAKAFFEASAKDTYDQLVSWGDDGSINYGCTCWFSGATSVHVLQTMLYPSKLRYIRNTQMPVSRWVSTRRWKNRASVKRLACDVVEKLA